MNQDQPRIESRMGRLLAYVRHNSVRMLTDGLILAAWILAASTLFGIFGLPSWLLYVVLFVGVVVYSRITPTWERPYRSPD